MLLRSRTELRAFSETPAYTMIPPPPKGVLGDMQLEANRSPGLLQTRSRPSGERRQKRDSSVNNTRPHSSGSQFLCSRAKFNRAVRWAGSKRGHAAGLLDINPASFNLR